MPVPFQLLQQSKDKMADNVRSEDVLGFKWDRCVSDTMIKFGMGTIVL